MRPWGVVQIVRPRWCVLLLPLLLTIAAGSLGQGGQEGIPKYPRPFPSQATHLGLYRSGNLHSVTEIRGGSGDGALVDVGKQGAAKGHGRLRDALFPIYGKRELVKFLAIGSIQFFIIFVLTLTRDMKDTLVVTNCGAEAISFLKVYGVLPAATMFMIGYSKMSTLLSKRALFYVTAIPFFAFYLLFALVFYPQREFLHPTAAVGSSFPEGLSYVVKLYQNWTFAVFYVVSELYSSVSIGVLFWQFANDIVPVSQAKRFYPLFGQLSSLAPVAAGQCVLRCAAGATSFGSSLGKLTALISGSAVAIFLLYEVSNALVRREREDALRKGVWTVKGPEAEKRGKKKPKLGLAASFKVLTRSKYLGYLSMLVLGYGLAINLTEVMWKSMVRRQYPDAVEYQKFMATYSSTLGMSTFVVIFFGSNLIKHVGWRAGALATPVSMALFAAPLFALVVAKGDLKGALLSCAVVIGAVQSILSKATKYALFDPTTQMAYIPLDEESKVKGKAAIDGVGSRLGKSGGSFLQQGLVLAFGNILRAAPIVAVIFYSVLGVWTYGAVKLAKLFEEKTREQEMGEALAQGAPLVVGVTKKLPLEAPPPPVVEKTTNGS